MSIRSAHALRIILIINLAFICGCSSQGLNSATATAQSSRASALATHVAVNLQTTLTAETVQATATAQALQMTLQAARQWPIVISDVFDANQYGWPSGSDSDPTLAAINWSIADGKYHWQAEAIDGFVWWVTPDMQDVSDFYLATDVLQLSGPEEGEFGLIFRQGGESNYYVFEINNKAQFAIYLHQPDDWESLLNWSDSTAIRTGETNRLAVLAQGSQLLFYINDQLVANLNDPRLGSGKVGLLIGLSTPKDKGAWDFDNFELRGE
jgi:hypothetical protein